MEDTGSLRPTVVEVSLARLAENFRAIQAAVAPAAVMPIVKANAYGHGLVPVARHLVALGARSLGVAFLEEAVALREAGVSVPILVMGGIFGDQIPIFLRHGLTLTASSIDKLKQIDAIADGMGVTATVHLKIDTGMERIGVHYYNARGLLERAADCRRVRVEGIYSHFANADALDLTSARLQLARFLEVLEWYDKQGVTAPVRHMANSGAVLQLRESHLDLVRPGILLYGVYPSIEVPADHSGEAGARAALARGVLQGRHARASGELRLHVAIRPPGARGHGAGGLRRRLLPRALQRGPRADPRPEVPGGGPHLHGPDHGQHRMGDRLQRRRGRPSSAPTATRSSPASTSPSGPAPFPTRSSPTSTPAFPASTSSLGSGLTFLHFVGM